MRRPISIQWIVIAIRPEVKAKARGRVLERERERERGKERERGVMNQSKRDKQQLYLKEIDFMRARRCGWKRREGGVGLLDMCFYAVHAMHCVGCAGWSYGLIERRGK